jgi:hypothetical protein
MTGKAETPPGAPAGTGRAVISLKGKSSQVCWHFSAFHGFTAPKLAHIHRGLAGAAGAIVLPLSIGPKFITRGCVPASAALIKAIAANPKDYYVNVHSTKYPGGAVRSQL